MHFLFHLLWRLLHQYPDRRLTALMMLGLSICCAGKSESATDSKESCLIDFTGDSAVIPLRFSNNIPIVDVVVNGQGPYSFMLDTGANNVILSNELIKDLKLTKLGPNRATGLDGRGVTVPNDLYKVDSLSIGPLRLKNGYAQNLDMSETRNSLDPKLQGMIGYWCLRQSYVRLDFPNSQMIIMKNPPPPQDGSFVPMRTIEEYFRSTPLPKTKTPAPCIPVQIGKHEIIFFIDTGFNASLFVSESNANSMTLYRTRLVSRATVLGQSSQAIGTRLDGNIKLGNVNLRDPYICWIDKVPGQNAIGMEILKQFTIDIDFIHGAVRFEHPSGLSVVVPDRTEFGISIDVKDQKAKVGHVDPRLIARKIDVQPGDEIIQIEGITADRFIKMKTMHFEKDSIVLRLRRNQKEFDCAVPVLFETYSK